jgi:hypothetical protein
MYLELSDVCDVVNLYPAQGAWCTTLCYKVCQRLAEGRWFSPGTPVSSTNKTDRRDIAEILLKVALQITNLALVDKSAIRSRFSHIYCQMFRIRTHA